MSYSLCGAAVENTGELDCSVSKGVLKRIFIDNGEILPANYTTSAAFFATLVTNSKLSKLLPNKVFPLPEIQDIVDASEANKEGSLNQGFKTTLLEGRPGYKVKFFGGQDLLEKLKKFNNKNIRIRELDTNGKMWGTKKGNNSIGYLVRPFFTGGKMATAQNVEEGVIEGMFSFLSTEEYYSNAYWVDVSGFNTGDIVPLIDISLYKISNVNNVWQVGLQIPGSSLVEAYNPYDQIGTLLATLGASFSAGSGASFGTELPITTVAANPTLKCLTITFDSTAYTALLAGAQFRLNPPTPTQLDTANITETEIVSAVFTK